MNGTRTTSVLGGAAVAALASLALAMPASAAEFGGSYGSLAQCDAVGRQSTLNEMRGTFRCIGNGGPQKQERPTSWSLYVYR